MLNGDNIVCIIFVWHSLAKPQPDNSQVKTWGNKKFSAKQFNLNIPSSCLGFSPLPQTRKNFSGLVTGIGGGVVCFGPVEKKLERFTYPGLGVALRIAKLRFSMISDKFPDFSKNISGKELEC